jgi:hypothetical protein
MPDLIIGNFLEVFLFDAFVRIVLVFLGLSAAVHYFLMARSMEEAPHVIRFGVALTAALGVICLVLAVSGNTWPGAVAGSLTGAVSIGVQLAVWGQGIYVRDQLNRAHEIAQAAKAASQYRYNLVRRDLSVPFEAVSDIVTPSGFGELPNAQPRDKERAL